MVKHTEFPNVYIASEDPPSNPEIGSLPERLSRIKQDLDYAYGRFHEALDPELIDCYIYQINSLTIQYNFLLRQSKNFPTNS